VRTGQRLPLNDGTHGLKSLPAQGAAIGRQPASMSMMPLPNAKLTIALLAQPAAQLRRAVDHQGVVTIDSVDDVPNVDVPMPVQALEAHIGKELTQRLLSLPQRYLSECASSDVGRGAGATAPRRRVALAGSFARRYVAEMGGNEQPLTSFHFDSAAVTVNVALSDDAAISGGRKLPYSSLPPLKP
jgi:hypothetical protein